MNQFRNSKSQSSFWTLFSVFAFPCVLLIWFLLYAFFRPENSDSNAVSQLRGSSSIEIIGSGANGMLRSDLSSVDHVVIVAGHAVVRVSSLKSAAYNDNGWYLLPYQRDRGFPGIITSHIQKGIDIASKDRNSLLLFSGGQTRKDVGPISEGLSYYLVSQINHWIPESLLPYVYLEEYAKDSYENLLFSLCRFKEATNRYPSRVTVVGFDFKSYRFTELHREAIRFPKENFTYVGLHPKNRKFDHNQAKLGEHVAVQEFIKDMYGCRDENLVVKKKKRNPFYRTTPYEQACPELKPLFRWCESGIFDSPEILPWNKNTLK